SSVSVPLLQRGKCLGYIVVGKREPGYFPEQLVSLLKTFADQAVIALENVGLFKELEARNRDLTASSEILRVISSSPTDVQPVFEAIMASAVRLCGGSRGSMYRAEDDQLHMIAFTKLGDERDQILQ